MKKKTVLAGILLAMSLMFVLAGCGGSEKAETEAGDTQETQPVGSGCAYDFPKTGFGFDLPEGVEITKGSIDPYDIGEIQYGSNLSMAWPVYWNCTEEERASLTEADADKVHTGGSFMIFCSGDGRDLEQTKQAYATQIKEETGEELSEEEIALLDEFEQIHQEGEYTWYVLKQPKSEGIPKDYQAEYDAFYDATDEILKNMTFYVPQVWRGGSDGSDVRFEATDLDGNAVDSEGLFSQNKITMINIWGTYCGPCINEMPELQKIHQEYADKGVTVVGLVIDVPEGNDAQLAEAKSIIKDTGVTYLNLRAWEGYNEQLAAPAVPTTYFVDSQGKLVGDPIVGANVTKYRSTLEEFLK
ncbi:MAG: TlpA family protein disulfide reductase [Firmicutes bacterium]|nr:TlpA family protein disulfide reductase [Bacillota bacterium]